MAGIDPSKYQDYVQGKISYEQAQTGYKAPTSSPSSSNSSSNSSSSNSGSSPWSGYSNPVTTYSPALAPYTKNATVDSWDTQRQLDYYKSNPAEAQKEITRAQGVGGTGANNWASSLQNLLPKPVTSSPATSYTGASSVIGNSSNPFGSKESNKSYQDLYASSPNAKTNSQLNTWQDKNGNIYDTTNMTPQQIHALSLNKDGNPNAAAILKGMGLDMNGNYLPGNGPYDPSKYTIPGVQNTTQPSTTTSTPSYSSGSGSSSNSGSTTSPDKFQQDMADLIAKQTAAQYAAQLAKLQQLRDTQLLGLAGQSNVANQNADSQANKASAANSVAGQRLKERMASMGLLDSGYNLENMSDLNAQRQSDLGGIEQQRSNNLQAITEQRSQINNAVAKGDLALLQELQANQAKQLIDLGYNVDSRDFRDRQFGWNQTMDQANLTGDYSGNRTLAGSAQDWGKTVDTANLTGQFNGQSTMAGKQANWNAMKDVWDASGQMVNPKSDWQGLLNQVGSGNAPLTQTAQQTKINNLWQSAQHTGFISDELADTVKLPRGTTTLDAQRLLLQQDQNAQGWAGLDIKQADVANGGNPKTLFTAGQLMNNIQDGLVTKTTIWDPNQAQYVTSATPVTDSNSRYSVYKQTILSGNGFTDAQMDAILAAGGFTPAEIKTYESQLSKEYGLSGK